MKIDLKLNKKRLKQLSLDNNVMSNELTPQIAGGNIGQLNIDVKMVPTAGPTNEPYGCRPTITD